MKTTAIKILTALCIALLPSVVSARTYRLVQCHIVEYGTGNEYDLQRSQYGADVWYEVSYDARKRTVEGKAPTTYYSDRYSGRVFFKLNDYTSFDVNGSTAKVYLRAIPYTFMHNAIDTRKSYLIYKQ